MRWTFVTVFFIAVMGVAAYFVFSEAVEGGAHVVVPDVVGLPVPKAQNILTEAGLEIGNQTTVVDDRFPEYHVMFQRPSANEVVRAGRNVSFTVSAGRQVEEAPNLVDKNVEDALLELETTGLVPGSMARIPHDKPRDVILAQDPPPSTDIPAGDPIHLLVSEGPAAGPRFMPDLVGRSVDEAIAMLAELEIEAVPYQVEKSEASYEVVLAQRPPEGSMIHEGQEVEFDFRPLPTTAIPGAQHKVTVTYTVPDWAYRPQVRVDVIDQKGSRETIYPTPADMTGGEPPTLPGGYTLSFPMSFREEATVEFYINDALDKTYYYDGGAEPVITDASNSQAPSPPEGVAAQDDEDSLVTVFEPRSRRIGPPRRSESP